MIVRKSEILVLVLVVVALLSGLDDDIFYLYVALSFVSSYFVVGLFFAVKVQLAILLFFLLQGLATIFVYEGTPVLDGVVLWGLETDSTFYHFIRKTVFLFSVLPYMVDISRRSGGIRLNPGRFLYVLLAAVLVIPLYSNDFAYLTTEDSERIYHWLSPVAVFLGAVNPGMPVLVVITLATMVLSKSRIYLASFFIVSYYALLKKRKKFEVKLGLAYVLAFMICYLLLQMIEKREGLLVDNWRYQEIVNAVEFQVSNPFMLLIGKFPGLPYREYLNETVLGIHYAHDVHSGLVSMVSFFGIPVFVWLAYLFIRSFVKVNPTLILFVWILSISSGELLYGPTAPVFWAFILSLSKQGNKNRMENRLVPYN